MIAGQMSGSQRKGPRSWLRRRLQGRQPRHRSAKIREPITRPEKPFRMDIPIFPTMPPARLGVINNPVLGLAKRLHERAMAHAPDLVGFFENRSMLRPRIG